MAERPAVTRMEKAVEAALDQVSVYVPSAFTANLGIVPGSGIVSGFAPVDVLPGSDQLFVLVDYEGNLYYAVNLARYADRVAHAWDRQKTQYPTVARSAIPAEQLIKVGEYDTEAERVALGLGTAMDVEDCRRRLATWLGVDELDENELTRTRP